VNYIRVSRQRKEQSFSASEPEYRSAGHLSRLEFRDERWFGSSNILRAPRCGGRSPIRRSLSIAAQWYPWKLVSRHTTWNIQVIGISWLA